MKVSFDGGLTFKEIGELRIIFDELPIEMDDQEIDTELHMITTSEGLIQDVVANDKVIATSSQTAQEIVEELTEEDYGNPPTVSYHY